MTRQRKPITSDNNTQRKRALAAARQRKRNKQWREALERAGWKESEYRTAVIKGEIELPTRRECEECGSCFPNHFSGCSKHPD